MQFQLAVLLEQKSLIYNTIRVWMGLPDSQLSDITWVISLLSVKTLVINHLLVISVRNDSAVHRNSSEGTVSIRAKWRIKPELGMKGLGVFLLTPPPPSPLDRMLVHRRVTPQHWILQYPFIRLGIINRGNWLWIPVNIKAANKEQKTLPGFHNRFTLLTMTWAKQVLWKYCPRTQLSDPAKVRTPNRSTGSPAH